MRRKGELSPSAIDRGWPHQVALRDDDGQYLGHLPRTGPLSSLCEREHNVTDGRHRYRVFCFSDRDWPAAGFVDIEIRCFMKPEVAYAAKTVWA